MDYKIYLEQVYEAAAEVINELVKQAKQLGKLAEPTQKDIRNDYRVKFESSFVGKNYEWFRRSIDLLSNYHKSYNLDFPFEQYIDTEIKDNYISLRVAERVEELREYNEYVKHLLWYFAHESVLRGMHLYEANYVAQLSEKGFKNLELIRAYPLNHLDEQSNLEIINSFESKQIENSNDSINIDGNSNYKNLDQSTNLSRKESFFTTFEKALLIHHFLKENNNEKEATKLDLTEKLLLLSILCLDFENIKEIRKSPLYKELTSNRVYIDKTKKMDVELKLLLKRLISKLMIKGLKKTKIYFENILIWQETDKSNKI